VEPGQAASTPLHGRGPEPSRAWRRCQALGRPKRGIHPSRGATRAPPRGARALPDRCSSGSRRPRNSGAVRRLHRRRSR
jgi:hypothetical protein